MQPNKKARITKPLLERVTGKAEENAKEYFKIAELLAHNGFYEKAYVNLVFCIEETAKAKICFVFSSVPFTKRSKFLLEKLIGINEKDLMDMFKHHKIKQLTIITQTILNLPEMSKNLSRDEVIKTIESEDCNKIPQIKKILRIFNNIQSKREKAMYVELATTKRIKKKDYEELHIYAKTALDNASFFRTFRNDYHSTERHIKNMLNKIV
ncbi:AbiV family abortive infection protein [Candidatus Woesearchaeota archaeon]|nr:AbiV family abortive infection protein [Candidatus Woesearchaeota archaeon]